MQCDMCGSEGKLYLTEIEGTTMELCSNCSKFGKVRKRPVPIKKHLNQAKKGENLQIVPRDKTQTTQELVEDYAKKIREKRQKLGLKQKELAVKIAEKESIIHKLEADQFRPPLGLARKLERTLGIKLIEAHVEQGQKRFKAKRDKLTIGDLMFLKKTK